MSHAEQQDGVIRAHLTYYVNGHTTGGWHSFPTTREQLEQSQRSLGVVTEADREPIGVICETGISALDYKLPRIPDLDELNYLAHLLTGMSDRDRKVFRAVMESGHHSSTMGYIINAAQNLGEFDLHTVPADDREFSELMVQKDAVKFDNMLFRLSTFHNPERRELAAYVKRLQQCVEPLQYGPLALADEKANRTSVGMLKHKHESFPETYTGPRDIPAEHRVTAPATERESLLGTLESLRGVEQQMGEDSRPRGAGRHER